MKLKPIILSLIAFIGISNLYAQVGIGTTSPHSSSILDITTTNKGLLLPRLTTAERNAIPSPAAGLLIFNISSNTLQFSDGVHWVNLTYLGETPINNSPSGSESGSVGIGTTTPNVNSILEIASTTKGFLPPRLTSEQRNAIPSPVAGLVIYNTTNHGIEYSDGSYWINIISRNAVSVNPNPAPAVSNGNVGMGTMTPDSNAILELNSPEGNKGFLLPRLTTNQRNAISDKAEGLMVYNTDKACIEWFTGDKVWHCYREIDDSQNAHDYDIISIRSSPCAAVLGATINDDPTTTQGVEYNWSKASNPNTGFGAPTNTRALVEIAGQCWARYNLNRTTPTALYPDGVTENASTFGRLYYVKDISFGNNPCPNGFRIPTPSEWSHLAMSLGEPSEDVNNSFSLIKPPLYGNSGEKISFLTNGGTGNNNSGFTGIFAGRMLEKKSIGGSYSIAYEGFGTEAWWWASDMITPTGFGARTISVDYPEMQQRVIGVGGAASPDAALSIRCVRDF